MEQCGPHHSYFVAYGQSRHVVDASRIEVHEAEIPELDKPQIEARAAEKLGRKIVVVGACTGSDAHTVGIDAILNVKGYAGEKGLEIHGLCLYPIVNHPGWTNNRHCHNGLWDYAAEDGNRPVYAPLAKELRRQMRIFAGTEEAPAERRC